MLLGRCPIPDLRSKAVTNPHKTSQRTSRLIDSYSIERASAPSSSVSTSPSSSASSADATIEQRDSKRARLLVQKEQHEPRTQSTETLVDRGYAIAKSGKPRRFIGTAGLDLPCPLLSGLPTPSTVPTQSPPPSPTSSSTQSSTRKRTEVKGYVPRDQNVGTFADFLRVVEDTESLRQAAEAVDFVTFRNNLNKIMAVPYDRRQGWSIAVKRFADTIYLGVCPTAADSYTSPYDPNVFQGYKFEHLCTTELTETPDDNHDNHDVIDPNSDQFMGVFRVDVNNKHKLLVAAELDAYQAEDGDECQQFDLSRFVELKTAPDHSTDRDVDMYFRFRIRSQWIQSHIVGVPQIYTGFKSRDGQLIRSQMQKTDDLPLVARGWAPHVCLSFLSHTLTFLRRSAPENQLCLLTFRPEVDTSAIHLEALSTSSPGIPDTVAADFHQVDLLDRSLYPHRKDDDGLL